MADSKTDEKAMAVVERELAKNPGATVEELFAAAKKVSRGVGKLTKRQFHARYPLQIKRRRAGPKKRTRKKRAPARTAAARTSVSAPAPGDPREVVRRAFMDFAQDMASAEARKDLVKFLAGVDKYVDAVLKATSR